ncbi:hypothetical protein GCM10017608_23210 [Agromyces luteolus]|uniref:Large extracellular alpha-helical protein n=1 Tax=Agromyces luteolus TaxID=88373 RepID=A0A7C9HHE3_9MICO|nr:DUF5719 family protein [Agromyces luteolus]MUN07006.1 hypothetical protein [Agromyces luteolus]GLK28387.1 hypothetical protein GCM10017608_23210 [Agromyces luteolus]
MIRGVVRGVAVVAAGGLVAGALLAASVAALPEVAAEPPSTVVQPAESRQLRVCPGPLLSLADDAAAAATARSVGAPELVVAADPESAAIEQVPLDAPDNAGAAADGGPVAISAEPGAVLAGMLAGAQSQAAATESLSGLAAAACVEPASDSWLVAGATEVGRSGLVLLANPGEVASTVDVRVVGEAGAVEAPAGLGIVVPPASQRVVSLAGLAPSVRTPVVHVTSSGAPIAAALQHSVVLGLEPAGVELSTPVAPPATRQVVPGLVVTDLQGVAPDEDHAEGDDFAALRLFAPDDAEASAVVEVRDEGGAAVSRIDVTLAAGQTTDLPLGALDPGSYTVVVDADAPVVAAARSTVLGDGDDPILADLAWSAATGPLLERAAVAIPEGPGASLRLANPGDAEVTATVAIGGAERSVTVPAGGTASVAVQGGDRVILDGVEGAHAAVTFEADDALASIPVAPPGPLDSPVRVFPQ